jgi:hypothetical protein
MMATNGQDRAVRFQFHLYRDNPEHAEAIELIDLMTRIVNMVNGKSLTNKMANAIGQSILTKYAADELLALKDELSSMTDISGGQPTPPAARQEIEGAEQEPVLADQEVHITAPQNGGQTAISFDDAIEEGPQQKESQPKKQSGGSLLKLAQKIGSTSFD